MQPRSWTGKFAAGRAERSARAGRDLFDERKTCVRPAARAAADVVDLREAELGRDPRGRLAAHTRGANEKHAVPRQRGLGARTQLLERNKACAGEVTLGPFRRVPDVDHVDFAPGDELTC